MNYVDPIKSENSIRKMESYLAKRNARDRLIFIVGINVGLRVSDIIKLKISDVKDKTRVKIREKKTGKYKEFVLNNKLQKLLKEYLKDIPASNKPLFKSRRGGFLNRAHVYRILNKAAHASGVEENIGTHSMRKTFGYHHYKKFKDIALLQKIFNHSSPYVTLRYIGITQENIDDSYRKFEL